MEIRIAIAALILVQASCSARETGATSRREGAASGDLVDPEPVLVIRSEASSADPAFLRAADGVRVASGVVAIVDPLLPGVRFFGPTGLRLSAVGRLGTGPGEFQSPLWIGQCSGDSLFVRDGQRMTVLSATGTFVRSYLLRGAPSALISCSLSGTIAVVQLPRSLRANPAGVEPRYIGALWLMDTRGDTSKTLGDIPLGETRPLGRLTRLAITADRLFVGTAESAFVDVLDLNGRHLATVEVGGEPRRPTTRNRERAIDRMLGDWTSGREEARRYLQQFPVPEGLPPYTELLADPAGGLWVVRSSPGDSTTMVRVLTVDGRPRGDIALPADTRVFEVGRDYILGVYQTDDGTELVAMYRIRRK